MPVFAGDPVYAADINTLGKVLAYGIRTTVTPSSSTWATSEVGSLRVDGISLKAGKLYFIMTNPISFVGSVVGDVVNARIRGNQAGVATTSSTELGHVRAYINNTSNGPVHSFTVDFTPTADTTTASFLLSVERAVSGTSSTGVRLWGNTSNEAVKLWVVDSGSIAPANTGVVI